LLADLSGPVRLPAIVIEIVLGIVVGPQVLDVARMGPTLEVLADIGLALLMFLAGYEIRFAAIRGRPLSLAGTGWLVSLAIGFAAAGVLMASNVVLSALYTGMAVTTTAIGTLLPILRDAGETENRFGTHVIAAGAVGEFAPILAVSLLLTSSSPGHVTAVLAGFVGLVALAMWIALRPQPLRVQRLIAETLDQSGQFGVRLCLVIVIALVWLAGELGLDILLGAFAAGLLVRVLLHEGSEAQVAGHVQERLEAISFGFFVPLFFVATGMRFDLDALLHDGWTVVRIPMFLGFFLLARGLPVLLYRDELERGERLPFVLLCATQLPLVVVITALGVEAGRMRPATASALVGAGMVSVLVFPTVALALRRSRRSVRLA
jgi:Kef-type K+ transport system membrane component KefB